VFVSPSFFEPFGITALESLLSGTPAIVGEGSGVMEKISGLGCILTVKPGNSSDLAEKIISVLERKMAVSEGDKKALKGAYSWEKSAREIEKIYQKLI
jgi:1,4-alpha-glucan branching enzyme